MGEQIPDGRESARRHASLQSLKTQRVALQSRYGRYDLCPDPLALLIALLE